jgi:hypothetical protein
VVYLPLLKNDGVRQLGWWHSQIWKNKSHVPNHQPDIYILLAWLVYKLVMANWMGL